MATKRIGNATEVITLADARKHLRLEPFGSPSAHPDDAYITSLITSAREWAELYIERAIGSQTLELALDKFPDAFKLTPYVQSVTSITYLDINNASQTVSNLNYVLDNYSTPSYVVAGFGMVWPETYDTANAVKIRYVAGYDNANPVPQPIISAMKLMIGHLYENRQQNVIGLTVNELPMGICSLLQSYRLNVGL